MRRLLIVLLATGAALAAIAAPARADLPWRPCADAGFQAFECATFRVPLDRSGAVRGETALFARRLRVPEGPATTAVVALAGGPGQAAAPIARQFAIALAPALGTRDLLVFDQRGTGRSGPLRCPSLRGPSGGAAAAARCASELGARRGVYRTQDSVVDLEALRAAGGYERLTLFGVSYGTKLALDYAAAFPDRVERLVLDSTVPPEGPDMLQRASFRAVPAVLGELCGAGRCRGITPGPARDVETLVRRGRDIRGRYVDADGGRRVAGMSPHYIYAILRAGDLNPAWRALLPAAVRAAVRGDATPLLRLAVATLGAPSGTQTPDEADNPAVYAATICEESVFPWLRGANPSERALQARSAFRGQPASVFRPFTWRTSAATSVLGLCLRWPTASPAPPAPRALPPVPALLLAGSADLRTPASDAEAVAARIGAGAVVLRVAHAGHSVLGLDASGCAQAAIASFFRDGTAPPCPASEPPLLPVGAAVRSLRALEPTGGYRGRVGRTITAVLRTNEDVLVRAAGHRLDGGTRRFGGLRGGTVTRGAAGVRMRKVQVVPGVSVSGVLPLQGGDARLTVRGRAAARGHLRFSRAGTVLRGRLGGRRIALRAREATARAARTSATSRLARLPALVRAGR